MRHYKEQQQKKCMENVIAYDLRWNMTHLWDLPICMAGPQS